MREQDESLSDSTKKYLEKSKFIKSFFTHIEKHYKNFVYICCFSDGINDNLSQWRGYADDGKGLCIGFNKDAIQELSNNSNKIKSEVFTNEEKRNDKVSISKMFAQRTISYASKEDILCELRDKIQPIIEAYDIADKNNYVDLPDVKLTQELYKKTFNYKGFYKNNSFISEKEYRLCFFDTLHEDAIGIADDALMNNMKKIYIFENGTVISELRYRESRGTLIPYREMKFPMDYFKKILSSVTIGPKNPMSVQDVQYFLISNGFNTSTVKVTKSESTYQ